MKRRTAYFLILIFTTAYSFSQTPWEKEANAFMDKYYKVNVGRLSDNALDSTIRVTNHLITEGADSARQNILANIYAARATLQFGKLKRLQKDSKSNTGPGDELYDRIEYDYKKSIGLCRQCECRHLGDLDEFYNHVNNKDKIIETNKRMEELGLSDDLPFFLGIGLNYIAPKNIAGAELTIVAKSSVFQKKTTDPVTGKKSYPCHYVYPVSFSILTVGYEMSLSGTPDAKKYNGVKFNPISFNAFVSVKASQFLFCNSATGNSFVWRPEIGYAFSTININYAFNCPFKRSFNYLPTHNISIGIIIPSIRLERREESD